MRCYRTKSENSFNCLVLNKPNEHVTTTTTILGTLQKQRVNDLAKAIKLATSYTEAF